MFPRTGSRSRRWRSGATLALLSATALVACRNSSEDRSDPDAADAAKVEAAIDEPGASTVELPESTEPPIHAAALEEESPAEREEPGLVEAEPVEDAVLNDVAFNDVIGIGGGAGGKYGGRFAGKRSMRAAGASGSLPAPGTETYVAAAEGGFRTVVDEPLSTFSIDVDTASYTNVRRFLRDGMLPPPDAVRVEELLNYFPYDYPSPADGRPLAVHVETASCPWAPEHRLVRLGLQTLRVARDERGPANLVFLVDVSGSMKSERKLPLVKSGLALLARQLDERDRVAIVTYAGASQVVLTSTDGGEQDAILAAIGSLASGGSTNGAAGIVDAYRIAGEHHEPGAISRVILATDGDFNVGVTDKGELVELIEAQARGGVFLTVLGFGTGNVKDATLEQLADRGNGHYAYVDSHKEARRVFVDGLTSTLETVAQDVKLQVEFNPREVQSYRLVGYANRRLANRDFNDDTKDAGEIGAGHAVTALYEIVPAGLGLGAGVDALKYQVRTAEASIAAESGELLTVKVRWKAPGAGESERFELAVRDDARQLAQSSDDFRFAAAVASFGMLLADSEHKGDASLDDVLALATSGVGADRGGERTEFLDLVARASELGGD